MESFEAVIALLLGREGYWTRGRVKVELTKEEKRRIGRPSNPRWELDLVAYRGATNELLVVECKSYLNSRGVVFSAFDGSSEDLAKRYKLFNDKLLWKTVKDRLVRQLVATGAVAARPRVRLALAAGNIATSRDRDLLKAHFERQGWDLLEEVWIRSRLEQTARSAYEDEVPLIVTKLLMKGSGK